MGLNAPGMTAEETNALAQAALGTDPEFHLGPFLLGPLFDAMLLGVITQQIITWYTWSSNERSIIKTLVWYSIVNAFVFTGYQFQSVLYNFALHYGDWRAIISVQWYLAIPFWDCLVGVPIQAFYVHRAYRLNNNNLLIVIITVPIMLTALGTGAALVYYINNVPTELDAGAVNVQIFIWLGCMMAADLIITGLVGYGLFKSRTGWSNTDNLVRRLIFLTVETQLAPTLVTLGFLIEFSIDPPGSIGIFFEICQSKFYIVGFLATLNSRFHLKREMENASGFKNKQAKTNTFALGTNRLQQATVNVTTDTYVESFQIPAERRGVNRDPAYELKEIPEASDNESMENLDYATNVSKKNLHDAHGM